MIPYLTNDAAMPGWVVAATVIILCTLATLCLYAIALLARADQLDYQEGEEALTNELFYSYPYGRRTCLEVLRHCNHDLGKAESFLIHCLDTKRHPFEGIGCVCDEPRTVWNGTRNQWLCDDCKRFSNNERTNHDARQN